MIAKLRELIDELDKLPEHLQEQAADRLEPIIDELIDQRWEELFDDPRSAAFFEQASRQIEATRSIGFGSVLTPSTSK